MTREEMAVIVERFTCDANSMAIAAELRKTCATCRHWNDGTEDKMAADCVLVGEGEPNITDMPADGSGFCHRWEPQPTGQAQEP